MVTGYLEGIQRCVVGIHRDSVVEAPCLDPLQIKAVSIVANGFVSRIKYPAKIPKHLLVALLPVPSKAMDLLVPLPLVTDADNGPFLQYVVMGDGELEARAPSQHHIGRGFNVEEKPSFVGLLRVLHKIILFL